MISVLLQEFSLLLHLQCDYGRWHDFADQDTAGQWKLDISNILFLLKSAQIIKEFVGLMFKLNIIIIEKESLERGKC